MTATPTPAALPADTVAPLLDRTIGDQLRLQADAIGERPAVMGASGTEEVVVHRLTYRGLLTASLAAAAGIARHAAPGSRVGVWAANSVQWVILEYASALAGTILVPLNTAWTDEEVRYALALTTPAMLFAASDGRGTDLVARARRLAGSGCVVADLDDLAIDCAAVDFIAPPVSPDDPFLIQFTSGTTGRPKGATLSHRTALNAGNIRALTLGATDTGVWANPIPLHHVGGAVIIVAAALCSGGSYVAIPRFEPRRQVAVLRAVGATHTGGVPTMFHALLDTPGFDESLAALHWVGLGGTNVPPSLVEQITAHGPRVSLAYAQSECPMVTQSDLAGDAEHVATTVGVPVPHTELRIVDPGGQVVSRGAIGEVCVRSPLTMAGYWNQPDASAEVFDSDGFLHTGDLGSIDDIGVLRIHGRSREVIIRGGENIYPAEIEEVIIDHRAVDIVAVVATPSPRWGEEVAAVVKLRTHEHATAEELEAFAAERLAHFKIPRHWRFVDDLPLTASGKVRKVELPVLFCTEEPS